MSSLNKAFIQVYKKNPKSSDRVNGPHFTIESESKPESQGGKVAPSASASTEGTVHFFRIDPPSDTASQPWLMSSVSTLGIDEYIAHSNQAPAATKPEAKTKSPIDSNKSASVSIPSARTDTFPNDLPTAPSQEAVPIQPIVAKTSMAAPILRTEEESRLDQDFYSNWVSATPTAQKEIYAKETVLPKPTFQEPAFQEPAAAVIYHAPPATVREESPQESTLPFQAVWEVDAFQWPSVIHDLHRRDPSILVEVGKHLRNACRTGLKVIAVTSEGARTRANDRRSVHGTSCRGKSGLTVALMDADLHHPELADKLNLEMAHGWEEAVLRSYRSKKRPIHSIEDRITLIPPDLPSQSIATRSRSPQGSEHHFEDFRRVLIWL
ncbi:MAG: hypothetical protein U0905_10320 [Pirellulales bacterium]